MQTYTVRMVIYLQLMVSIMCAIWLSNDSDEPADTPESENSPAEVCRWFAAQDKTVVTFMGFSGAGYEDPKAMLEHARHVLSDFNPQKTIVNSGATPEGIGAVYELAKRMGFPTTGIVSTQAKKYEAAISPHVDRVFYIPDETWGGCNEGSDQLNPTSEAMVGVSDVVVSIGGGAVSRDEITAAQRQGRTVKYIAADMNHAQAVQKAQDKRLPVPTDFKGDAYGKFGAK